MDNRPKAKTHHDAVDGSGENDDIISKGYGCCIVNKAAADGARIKAE